MNPILEKVNEQMDGKYVIEYTYVANTDYNNVLSTQLASGEGPDIIMDGTNYPAEIKAGNVEDISDYDFVKSLMRLECRFAVLMEKFMEFLPMDGFPEFGVMLRSLRNVGWKFPKHLMSL